VARKERRSFQISTYFLTTYESTREKRKEFAIISMTAGKDPTMPTGKKKKEKKERGKEKGRLSFLGKQTGEGEKKGWASVSAMRRRQFFHPATRKKEKEGGRGVKERKLDTNHLGGRKRERKKKVNRPPLSGNILRGGDWTEKSLICLTR